MGDDNATSLRAGLERARYRKRGTIQKRDLGGGNKKKEKKKKVRDVDNDSRDVSFCFLSFFLLNFRV